MPKKNSETSNKHENFKIFCMNFRGFKILYKPLIKRINFNEFSEELLFEYFDAKL
jgi:hypothetical protein